MLLSRIIEKVLNHTEIIKLTFRSMSVQLLLYKLGQIKNNFLVIGSNSCWMINSKTCHENYFLGTERKISLKP